MTRYLGIDYGAKRIGIAVGDDEGGFASPVATIEIRGSLAEQARLVAPYAEEYDVDAFVVGLPLNMDGTEGAQAAATPRFRDELCRLRYARRLWTQRSRPLFSKTNRRRSAQSADQPKARNKTEPQASVVGRALPAIPE